MSDPLDDLDAHVRRADPDRWLAARFVNAPAARRELLALYALADEWARIGGVVTQPLIGEMRFAWWRETLDAAAAGSPRHGHPLVEALAPALAEGRLPRALLEPILDAREADLENAPFADRAAVARHLDGVQGGLMQAAAVLLDAKAASVSTRAAGRAYGWSRLPPERFAGETSAEVFTALHDARAALAGLPVASFPAVAHATLARDYARGRSPSELGRRARLLIATTLGRV